jgi:5'-nucleotidase
MPSMKQVLVGVLGLGLTVTGLSFALPAAPAQAVGGVFISEIHYDNTGTDSGEFVEVTAAAGTDLSTYSIVLYNAGGTIPGQSYDTDALSGTVTDQQDGWGTGVLSYPSNGVQNGAPDGVALVNNGTLVEFLSYEGSFSATNGPANGIASTDIGVLEVGTEPTGLSLQRLENNTWTGPAAHTSGTPNGYDTGGEPPALAATAEPDAEAIVDEPMTPVVLDATGGTPPYTWTTASTLPAGVTLSTAGELSGTPTETGTFPITATVTDDEDATDDVSFTLTVSEPAGLITIAEVQGTDSAASPLDGQDVLVEGVVTGVYADPYDAEPGMSNYGGLDGFYLQTAGTGGTSDATPGASDAVFVYTGNDVPAGIAVGDSVEVDGTVDEFGGLTEIVSPTVTETDTPLTAVNPLEIAYPATSAEREAQEGMLLAPTGMFTVTNSFATNQFGEVGLATGDEPLKQPTEYERPSDTAALQAIKDENAARAVVLDDGTSINYFTNGSAQQDFPLPWLTPATPVRVGAEATLVAPVLLDYRNNAWKFQPQEPVLDAGTDVATFEDTRAQNAQPQEVGGDLKIATFNVLNYFPTTGEEWVAAGDGRTCTFFTDRDANPIGNNRCEPNGPRGAANQVNFERQQAKIVAAINGLDADIVGLEELENSIQMPGASGRDDAAAALVAALNAEAGAGTWDYVPSPAEASTPEAVAEQDVIRGGFIYKPATVELVGESALLLGTTEFTNAREPLGQAFKAAGASDFEAFVVIVNHFKSKGDSNPPATGDNANNPDTGAFNGDRVRQANRLVTFANEFAAARGTDRIFLAGDFNSYTHEDPMHVLYDAGFEPVESDQASDESYSFSGLSGSLDHVLASPAASELVTGADIWEINANESVAYQYSRYNYNVTNLYVANQFAASDHNPEIVGIAVPDLLAPSVTAPDRRIKSHRDAQIPVTVTADGVVPTGEVSLSHGGTELGCVLLESDGSAVVTIPAGSLAARKAPYELTIAYSGDASVAPGTGSVTVTVKGPRR